MRCLFGFLCVCALGVVPLPLNASAQAGEADTTSEPNPQEPAPSAEPAPAEPALELKLDDAGVEVVPSPPRTPDGYTLEETELRVRRAKIGLWSTAGATVLGGDTCSAECASHECWAIADVAQPYAATITVSDNAWTLTALATAQMVSDEFTPCEAGQTMVFVAVPK